MWTAAICVITPNAFQCIEPQLLNIYITFKSQCLLNVTDYYFYFRFSCFSVFGLQEKSEYESITLDLPAAFFINIIKYND